MRELSEKIKKIVDSDVRPALKRHGGDMEFKKIKNGTAVFEIKGVCKGCPMSKITFEMGVNRILKEKLPEIKKIKYI